MIAGVILAGGRSSRMGVADKCLLPFGGSTIIGHVIATLAPQISRILINSNSDADKFLPYDLPVRADIVPGYCGPLAGILTGMRWAEEAVPGARHILAVAGDMPFLPFDLAGKLSAAIGDGDAAIVLSDGRTHPTAALWRIGLAARLEQEIVQNGLRKMHDWLKLLDVSTVEYPASPSLFFNINSQTDLAGAAAFIDVPTRGHAQNPVPA